MLLDTPLCDFGWKGPNFTLKDPDGNTYSMEDCMGENGLLIAFICNHCPYVLAIASRLSSDAKTLKSAGINVVAIMSNDYAMYHEDSPAKMKLFASQYDFDFPYLVDETQEVAKQYNAVCTPDFFGLNPQGELQYRGRLDDAKMANPDNRTPELLAAMQQVAQTGKGPKEQYPSMGCSIKWR
jgi:peroxiredoxin